MKDSTSGDCRADDLETHEGATRPVSDGSYCIEGAAVIDGDYQRLRAPRDLGGSAIRRRFRSLVITWVDFGIQWSTTSSIMAQSASASACVTSSELAAVS